MLMITLNGQSREVAPGVTVALLVAALCAETERDPRGMAIERNREIVPKSLHAATLIETGDAIEIVQFVGGG